MKMNAPGKMTIPGQSNWEDGGRGNKYSADWQQKAAAGSGFKFLCWVIGVIFRSIGFVLIRD